MGESCCICGVVLAAHNSDFPSWCKTIRGICQFQHKLVLSNEGSIDDDVVPFNLRISNELVRFRCRRACGPRVIGTAGDFCYPFHTACWLHFLFQEGPLLTLFSSCIYHPIPLNFQFSFLYSR
ncbi:hypothetical protein BKA65DRAFT_494715 [Rhexocercosporidium sp. MPI-PUGE-AT-0058]|nr:hypothetical protein BKA65DRAFT_494715 [Rhexocercosporidium sp. MPI-PUGE-AT-0058]